MTLGYRFKIPHLILATALTIGLGMAKHANAFSFLIDLDSREVTQLGTLAPNAPLFPIGMNDVGQVAGTSRMADGYHAFITGPNGVGITDLGVLGRPRTEITGINDSGQLVGWLDKGD